MKIAGFDYMSGYNGMPNFDTEEVKDSQAKVAAGVPSQGAVTSVPATPVKTDTDGSSSDTASKQPQTGYTSLDISEKGRMAARTLSNEAKTATTFPSNDFSTLAKTGTDSAAAGNAVLNQYRFFVPNTNYSGEDGVVKRIFK